MNTRIKHYNTLHNKLKYMTNTELSTLFNKGALTTGYGKNSVTNLGNHKLFIKKIPCTQLEYNNIFNTSNLYKLPSNYNYGVGSAGINCFRELLTHIKTTKFVLNGILPNFPLMYHYRILKNTKPYKKYCKRELQEHFIYWNSNKNIQKYIIDRANPPYEIMIVLEYFPNVLSKWLQEDTKNILSYEKQIRPILDFLYQHKIIHFDTHMGNIVVRDGIIYLTDFGLVLDLEFDLSTEEISFFHKNNYYDYGLALLNISEILIGWTLYSQNKKDQEYFNKTYGFKNNTSKINRKIIYDNLDDIFNYLKLDNKYKKLVIKYKGLSDAMTGFFYGMRRNKKDEVFPNGKIKNIIV